MYFEEDYGYGLVVYLPMKVWILQITSKDIGNGSSIFCFKVKSIVHLDILLLQLWVARRMEVELVDLLFLIIFKLYNL